MSKKLNHLAVRLVVVAALGLALGQAEAKTKPNVLFIFADDQCYETVANLGHTDIDTPNLDRLAKRAARSSPAPTTWVRGAERSAWPAATC